MGIVSLSPEASEVLYYVWKSLQFVTLAVGVYYIVISMFGWFRRAEPKGEEFAPEKRFALIVCAHNEEAVVSGIIRSLKRMKYPQELYDIFVIADNCTDKTAEVARAAGADVHERFDDTKRGKGYSLTWMFERLFALEKQYDAVGIFDADNLVSSNFLLEMNKQLVSGNKVIQGYLDSKNPHDTWISGNYSLSYWIANRLFQLPRHYLGLNCALGGTGFVMDAGLLKEMGWDATCLTEDLEFSIKMVLSGYKVSWSHDAKVYDEKPLGLWQSWRQRTRWMQGHTDCAERYVGSLVRKAVKDRSFVALDAALYLLQPFNIILGAFMMLMGFVQWATGGFASPSELPMYLFIPVTLLATYITIVFVYVEKKLTPKVALYFLISPLFGVTWIPIIIKGFMDRKKKVWNHTVHTRNVDIDDIEEKLEEAV